MKQDTADAIIAVVAPFVAAAVVAVSMLTVLRMCGIEDMTNGLVSGFWFCKVFKELRE